MDTTQQPTRRIIAVVFVGVLVAFAGIVAPMVPLQVMVLFMVPLWMGLVGWAIAAERAEKRRHATTTS